MAVDKVTTAGQQARTISVARSLLAAIAAMTDSSRVANTLERLGATLRRAWTTSSTETGASQGLAATGRIVRESRVHRSLSRARGPIQQAIDRSAVATLAWGSESAIRSSWLYRWLTAEPEPEVIVIDLRETVSVGPFIDLLDRLVRALVPASHRSAIATIAAECYASTKRAPVRVASLVLMVALGVNLAVTFIVGEPTRAGVGARVLLLVVAILGTRVSMTWEELLETRVVQLLIAALEPPEPPDGDEWE